MKRYDFTVSDEHHQKPFDEIWDIAQRTAAEQEIFEQMAGGTAWGRWRTILVDYAWTPGRATYQFEAHDD